VVHRTVVPAGPLKVTETALVYLPAPGDSTGAASFGTTGVPAPLAPLPPGRRTCALSIDRGSVPATDSVTMTREASFISGDLMAILLLLNHASVNLGWFSERG